MMPDNTFNHRDLEELTPTPGGEIPWSSFVYKGAMFQYYSVTYYNPQSGVILYDYTSYTNLTEAAMTAAMILLGGMFGALSPFSGSLVPCPVMA